MRYPKRGSPCSTTAGHSLGGTVDFYLAPQPPAGHETNWIPTRPGERFELIFRFFGVQPAVREKSWTLPDPEPIS